MHKYIHAYANIHLDADCHPKEQNVFNDLNFTDCVVLFAVSLNVF